MKTRAFRGLQIRLSKISPFANQEEEVRPPIDKQMMLEALKTYIESSIIPSSSSMGKQSSEREFEDELTKNRVTDYFFFTSSGEQRGLRIVYDPIGSKPFWIRVSESDNKMRVLDHNIYDVTLDNHRDQNWLFRFREGAGEHDIDKFLADFGPFAAFNNIKVDLEREWLIELIARAARETTGKSFPDGQREMIYKYQRVLESIKIKGKIVEDPDVFRALIDKIEAILVGFRIRYNISLNPDDGSVEIELFGVKV